MNDASRDCRDASNHGGILFRSANLGGTQAISELLCLVAERFIGPTLGEGGIAKVLKQMSVGCIRERIELDWPAFCAWSGDSLVGTIFVKPEAHLYHLFVLGSSQRKGVGQHLFQLADQASLQRWNKPLETVNSSVNAIDFYEQLGFQANGSLVDCSGVRCQPMVRQ